MNRKFESERLLTTIDRGGGDQLRVYRVRTHDGFDLFGIGVWKKTWRREQYVPDQDRKVWLKVEEAPAVAEALQMGARR